LTKRFVKELRGRAPAFFSRRSFLIVALPAFAIFYFVSAVRIQSPPVHLQVSARAFPIFVGGALLIAAAVVAWQELRERKSDVQVPEAAPPEALELDAAWVEIPEAESDEEITSWRDFWVALGAIVAMAVLMDDIGFILAATGLVAGLSIYFERRHIVRNIALALAYAAVLYYLFDSLFEIFLPNGPLPW
jgi:hypothetical protein